MAAVSPGSCPDALRLLRRRPAAVALAVAVALALALAAALAGPGGLPTTPHFTRPATTPLGGSLPVRYVVGRPPGPPVQAQAAILMEVSTGTILYAKNEHQRRAPASTTKIVTALLALESGRLNDRVRVSRRAASVTGSSADLAAGEVLTLEELLYGLMLPSGNDAAVAIAEHLAGSEAEFAAWMTRRARELGAYESRFENPHGLDSPGHYTSAYDLAILARTAMQFPTFARIVGQKAYTDLAGRRTWHNTNRLLWSFEGATGIKTGTTGRAGHCLVAAANREGMQVLAVVLGSSDRWGDAARLLEYGLSAFALVELARRGDEVARLPLGAGAAELQVVAGQRLALVVPVRRVKDVRGVVALQRVRPPLRAGQAVGRLTGYLADEPFGWVPLVAGREVSRPPWWRWWGSGRR
ncbi:MAG TPA: D-alanyl-D-alanine carboxypeptidase family protein [Limnochordales bacterium]